MLLWLDDIRTPPSNEPCEWFKDPWSALRAVIVRGHDFTSWSLDHDLGENVPTGYDFLCMLTNLIACTGAKLCLPVEINIHSANPVGRRNMQRAITDLELYYER